jgi:hypothetical protein
MKAMWRAIGCVLLLAGAAHADDPAGTQTLELYVDATKFIVAPDGSRIVCDDPSVVSADLVDGKLQLRGLKVGTTLCGVRHPGELPGGLYRVRVAPKPPKEKTETTGG